MKQAPWHRQSGFTLLEVVVAIAIIGLLFPVVFGIITGSRSAVKDGEWELVAIRIAEDVMEAARESASRSESVTTETLAIALGLPDTIDPEAGYEVEKYPYYTCSFVVEEDVTVEVEGETKNLDHAVQVRVRVEWQKLRGDGVLEISSILYLSPVIDDETEG